MSANPETRFICDRCLDYIMVPMHNAPVHARAAAPEGWMTLTLGVEPATPPTHLCPPCATGLTAYLQGAVVSTKEDA